jgi:NAD(P)-dependent dehydrogenase (short-subunit alcohol dehydrogenase family)
MSSLSGRGALITGGGSGMGRATCELLAQEGANVLLLDLNEQGGEVEEAIKAAGGNALFVRADASDPEQVEAALDAATEAFGGFDILFNCAGIIRPGTLEESTLEDWNRVLACNLTAQWVTSRAIVPRMRAAGNGGVIINMTSAAGMLGIEGLASYCASKAGVLGLTRSLAAELAPDNIRAIALSPGTVDTPMPRAALEGVEDPEGLGVALFTTHQAIKRVIQPEEVARMVRFLVSEDASLITGSRIDFDAGWVATQDAH